MSSKTIPVAPFDLVIFGGTGDLAMRKLLPALYRRLVAGQMPASSRIICLALDEMDRDSFREQVRAALLQHLAADEQDATQLELFLACMDYSAFDATDAAGWQNLKATLEEHPDHIRVYYLAVGPALFGVIANGLAQAGLAENEARLVVEKPLGHDLESANNLNQQLSTAFAERYLYRIDHYLGKETVQNLMALRFANALFEPLWNSHHIDHVQITAAESLGVGKRGSYYDKAGAIRDMVQNHLLQLLCLIAMEPPHRFEADAVRDEKLKVLYSLRPLTEQIALAQTARGQYRAAGDKPSYREEAGNPDSNTECFVAIKANVDNWRWAGVPFYLRTGKKLQAQFAEIAIYFKEPQHCVFSGLTAPMRPNVLSIRLQPDEGLQLNIMTKDPGPGGFRMHETPLDMSFSAFSDRQRDNWRMPDAYERLLMDVVRGDQTLFMRGDEVEAAWEWIDPIIAAWQASGYKPDLYEPGSSGPVSAIELLAKDGRRWREIQ